jgi:hypothetical protein
MSRPPRVLTQELLDTLVEKQPNGCWLWLGAVRNGKPVWWTQTAAREVALMQNGSAPCFHLSTSCGNALCVAPEHIVNRRTKEHVCQPIRLT